MVSGTGGGVTGSTAHGGSGAGVGGVLGAAEPPGPHAVAATAMTVITGARVREILPTWFPTAARADAFPAGEQLKPS